MTNLNHEARRKQKKTRKSTRKSPPGKRRKISFAIPTNRSISSLNGSLSKTRRTQSFRNVTFLSPNSKLQRRVAVEDIDDTVQCRNRLSRPRQRIVVGRLSSVSTDYDNSYDAFCDIVDRYKNNRAASPDNARRVRSSLCSTSVDSEIDKDTTQPVMNKFPKTLIRRYCPQVRNAPIILKSALTQTVLHQRPKQRTKILKERATSMSAKTFHNGSKISKLKNAATMTFSYGSINNFPSYTRIRSCLRSRSYSRRNNSRVTFNDSLTAVRFYPCEDTYVDKKCEQGRRTTRKKRAMACCKRYPQFKNKQTVTSSILLHKRAALIPHIFATRHDVTRASSASNPKSNTSFSSDDVSSMISYIVTVKSKKDLKDNGKVRKDTKTSNKNNIQSNKNKNKSKDNKPMESDNEGTLTDLQSGAENTDDGEKSAGPPTYIT